MPNFLITWLRYREHARVGDWPCAWPQLQNDLWAIALMLLPEAKSTWAEFDDETTFIGRDFEVWRGNFQASGRAHSF